MTKLWLYILIGILLSSFAYAQCINGDNIYDKATNFCTSRDGVCDDGENPLIFPGECEFSLEEMSNLKMMSYGWFIKLVLAIGIIWVVINNHVLKDRNFQIIIVMIILLIYLTSSGIIVAKTPQHLNTSKNTSPTEPKNVSIIHTELINGQLVQVIDLNEEATAGGVFKKVLNLGGVVWPSKPLLGWALLFFILIAFVASYKVILEKMETVMKSLFFKR